MKTFFLLVGRCVAGMGGFASCAAMPFKKYPFTFPEKALTADWMALGNDINKAMEKIDAARNRA